MSVPEVSPRPSDDASLAAWLETHPLSSRTRKFVLWYCAAALVCLAVIAATRSDGENVAGRIAILQPGGVILRITLFAAGFSLAIAAAVLLGGSQRLGWAFLAVAGYLGIGIAVFLTGVIVGGRDWQSLDQITTADGSHYSVLSVGILQNIARQTSSGLFFADYETVGQGTFYDLDPNNVLLIVRPSPPKPNDWAELYVNDNGVVVCTHGVNGCVMAYDTKTQHFYTWPDLKQLSPFLLLGGSNPPYEPDLKTISDPSWDHSDWPDRPSDADRQTAARILQEIDHKGNGR